MLVNMFVLQVIAATQGVDQSSPVVWGRVLGAATGARHSVLIASDHSLQWLGKHKLV